MRVVTLNVRNPSFDDGPNAWSHRRETFFEVLRTLDPDVLCLQETIKGHIEEIFQETKFDVSFGLPREEEVEGTEYCAVMTEIPIVEWDTEWLCETPKAFGSFGWDAKCPRVMTWVEFDAWALINAHLDHVGLNARTNGMRQILARADAFGKPCLIVGDFNATPDEPALALAREAGFVDLAEEGGPTYDGFRKYDPREEPINELKRGIAKLRSLADKEEDPVKRQELLAKADEIDRRRADYEILFYSPLTPPEPAVRIDYILARGPWKCERAWVERDAPAYSDHRAVVADLELG